VHQRREVDQALRGYVEGQDEPINWTQIKARIAGRPQQ
jgi:hypothetical protein